MAKSSIKTKQIQLLNLYHTYRQQNINICSKTYQSALMPTKTSTPTTKDETKVCYYSVFDICYQLSADTMQKLEETAGGNSIISFS